MRFVASNLLLCFLSLSLRLQIGDSKRSRILQNDNDADTFEYEAVTDVSFFLNLAYDAADMRKADQDTETKVDIYYNGRHAFVDDDEGNQTNISFAGLSLGASQVMFDDPLYNIYRHAFYDLGVESENDVEGNFDGHPVEEYGNTLVMDLFELNSTRTETEGAIVINVWMAAAHEFSNIVRTCRGAQAGDTTIADTMNRALDRAAALWIGADQVRGDNIHGHLLYNIAENAGELFGQDTGETWVNAQLMDLVNSIQTDIINDSCLLESGYKEMRVKVHQALSYMTVPLVQMLIHHIMQVKNEAGSDMVELYSLALAPRVAACDPTRYDDMLQMMVFGDLLEADVEKALQLVQSVFSCLDITCKDVGAYQGNVVKECDDSANAKQPMAGYTPSTDVRTKSYIDRDILQIAIFLQYEAYDTAMDWYEYGQNSKYSLYELATNKVSPYPSNQFDLFDSYYNSQLYDFADSMIVKVLSKEKPFDTASAEQRTEIVLGILQSVVMFLSTISELQSAITVCQQNGIPDQNQMLQLWDGGAAFFIGSIEGTETGGYDGGQLLYGAAKDFCQSFQTCEPDDAAVNKAIIQALAFGSQALLQAECNQANTVYQQSILPALYIPLIQGTLLYAQQSVGLTAGTKDSNVGGLYAYSRSVLPHINQAWPDSADKLSQSTDFQLTSAPLGGSGLPSIMNDFRNALSHISTDCKEVGSLGPNGGLCAEDIQAVTTIGTQSPQSTTTNITYTTPTSNGDSPIEPIKPVTSPETSYTNQFGQPNELAWGRYSFSSPQAKKDGNFAMDIKDMKAASDIVTTKSIYQGGRHALTGLFEQADIQSLESFSTLAADMMDQDPMFNFFRFALYEESTFEGTGEEETWSFADMVVKLALNPDNGNDAQLAAEASVVMNVWMMIAHRLYDAARMCEDGENPNQILDSAVALWLGDEQQEGKYDAGYMIYNVAQRAQKFYGITSEGEAAVNTDLMAAFNEAKVLGQFCPTQSKTFLEYRVLVFNMIKLLTKPIIQNLMYYISIDDLDYTELYALAVIPQAISCRTSTYLALKAALVDSFSKSTSITDKFYDDFGDFLTCLDMTCEDLGDITSASVELKALVSSICQKQQQRRSLQGGFPSPGGVTATTSTTTATTTTSAEKTLLAGYLSTVDVSQEARIDMDIRQIDILMRTRASEAAADLYMYGKNSKTSNRALLSLQKLATTEDRKKIGPPFQVYSSYFLSDTYADELILSVFRKGAIYAKATRSQSAEIVTRALQSMVSYMAVLEKSHASVEACKGNKTSSVKDLDTAVAFFVGSLEGTKFGGNKQGEGLLMYGLAEENCGYFGTCEATGEAEVNRKMIFGLADMRDQLQMQRCDAAEKVFNDTIVQLMPVPLIESSVRYAAYNEQTGDSPDEDATNLAAGLILTSAVLPLVQAANPESATTISKNVDITLETKPIPGGATAIATAFAQSLKSMGVSCEDVGTFSDAGTTNISLCTADNSVTDPPKTAPPSVDTPVNLGDDLYVTTTYIQDRADIALDIKSMEQALRNNHKDFAKLIYTEGENSNVYDKNGNAIDHRTLAGFSINATRDMEDESLFNIFVSALQEDGGQYKGAEARLYADTIVRQTFELSSESAKMLPTEAAVALNLWMYLVHKLHATLRACKTKQATTDTDAGVHLIDEAVAYWIGDGQIAGDAERGHLLYALAERMGEEFGLDKGGQTRTNTNILKLFQKAKAELSVPSACSDDPDIFKRLNHIHYRIVSQMTIPLIQALIHNLRIGDADRVKVYAHAFVPMVSACSPSTFDFLNKRLLGPNKYNVVEVEEIIEKIRSTLPCFNLQCEDIGIHSTELEGSCTDPPILTPLAGYRPASDVRELAQLDLDILELDILMQMAAYEAAEELYTYGKHTIPISDRNDNVPYLSLAQLATASGRSAVPQLDSFARYYSSDKNYADTIIRGALTNTDYGFKERRMIVVKTNEFLVMYMAALQGFYEAAAECESNTDTNKDVVSAEDWDKGAAFIIGHLEGPESYGSSKNDGRLFFALSKKHCVEFGTCPNKDSGYLSVIDRIESLLYTGRGAVLSGSCTELRKATTELLPLLLVPLIQATLSFTLNPNQHNDQSAQVEAYIYASAMLPLIEDVDRDAAATIRRNLEKLGKPFPDGTSAVVSSFAKAYPGLGVKCEYLGTHQNVDVCNGTGAASQSKLSTGLIVGIVIMCLAVIGSVLLVYRSKLQKSKVEDPVFVASNGELNHTEDLLTRYNDIHRTQKLNGSTTFRDANGDDSESVAMITDDEVANKSSTPDVV